MADPEREFWIEEAIEVLKAYWLSHPELRLGQIVSNASYEWNQQKDVFNLPDTAFFFALGKLDARMYGQRKPDDL